MTCDNNGRWGYSKARQVLPVAPTVPDEMDELDDFPAYESDKEDLDEDIDEIPPLTVPLANAYAAAIKYLQSS